MIIKFSELPALRRSLRNKKIVFAGGAFDLLHQGHIEALKDLRRHGDIVVIAVSSDTGCVSEKVRHVQFSTRESAAC